MNSKFMDLVNKDGTMTMYIHGDIVDYKWWEDDVTAKDIRDQLTNFDGNVINVHINSLGGDCYTGIAIYNMLKQHKASVNVYIDSIAASIASVIAMAGDKIYMPKNTSMMIHNCWTYSIGNSKELRKTADDMDKIMTSIIECYMAKIKITKEELIQLLDEESFLTADECFEKGFADEIIELKETNGIQQHVLFTIFNRASRKESKPTNEFMKEEDIEKIAVKVSELVLEKMERSKPEVKKEDQDMIEKKKDSFCESFLNAIIQKEEN